MTSKSEIPAPTSSVAKSYSKYRYGTVGNTSNDVMGIIYKTKREISIHTIFLMRGGIFEFRETLLLVFQLLCSFMVYQQISNQHKS